MTVASIIGWITGPVVRATVDETINDGPDENYLLYEDGTAFLLENGQRLLFED